MDMHYSSDYAEDQNYKPQQVEVSGRGVNIHFANLTSTGRVALATALDTAKSQRSSEDQPMLVAGDQIGLPACC